MTQSFVRRVAQAGRRNLARLSLPGGRLALLAALVCLLGSAALRDGAAAKLRSDRSDVESAPPGGQLDAALKVSVRETAGQPVPAARVRVFSIIREAAFLVGQGHTDESGTVTLTGLRRGECWIIAEAADRARASTRLVLEAGTRAVSMKLAPARLFEVVAVDVKQRPIRGVQVRLFGADPLPHIGETDRRGLARLSGLGPAPYAVELRAAGFEPKFLPSLTLEDSPLFLRLEQLGVLVVKVVEPVDDPDDDESDAGFDEDDEFKPAAGATVTVAGSALWPARTAVTDDTGQVTISGLPRGFYDLKAQRDNLVSDSEPGVLLERGENKTVRLSLVPGLMIRVKVTDGVGPGAPAVADADVAVVERGVSSFPLYGRTDARGLVILGPVVGDDVTVSARAEGFVPRSALLVEQGQSEIQIGLSRGATLAGRIFDEREFPVDGASLEVVGVDLDGMPIAESSAIRGFREDHFSFALPGATPLIPAGELGVMPVVPDIPPPHGPLLVARSHRTRQPWVSKRDGTFEINPVPPGRVRLVVRHPDYVETLSDSVTLPAGGRAELKIILRQGGALEGRVLESDRTPVAGARVEVAALEGSLERITYAADDGSFAFAALPEQVLVSVARPQAVENIVIRQHHQVPAQERTEIEILLPERRDEVSISVVDDRGYPLDRVQLSVSCLEPAVPLRKTLFTDDRGKTLLADARGLPLRIVQRRSGKAPAVTQLDAAPRRIELVMRAPLRVRGEVRTRYEQVPGAEVILFSPTGLHRTKSNADGEFSIGGLAPTSVRLQVTKRGFVPHELKALLRGDPDQLIDLGRIELEPAGSVTGVVLDENEKPLAGVRVAAGRVPTYLPLGPLPLGIGSTDRQGRFQLPNLAPGSTAIEAFAVGVGRSAVSDVLVRAGETTKGLRIILRTDERQTGRGQARGAGSLAVTLGERSIGQQIAVVFEHVPQGGEAQRAGIEPGDQLLAVNGVTVRTIEQARRRVTGPLSEDLVVSLARQPDLRWSVRVSRERLRR